MYIGSRATRNLQNFMMALNTMKRFFLTLPKVVSYHAYQNLIIQKILCAGFELQAPKAVTKDQVLAGYTVVMVTYCITNGIATCSPTNDCSMK